MSFTFRLNTQNRHGITFEQVMVVFRYIKFENTLKENSKLTSPNFCINTKVASFPVLCFSM